MNKKKLLTAGMIVAAIMVLCACGARTMPQSRPVASADKTAPSVSGNADAKSSDDYDNVQAARIYEPVVKRYMQETFGLDATVKAEIQVLRGPVTEENAVANASGIVRIFFARDGFDKEDMRKVVKEFSIWLAAEQQGSPGDYRFYCMTKEAMAELEREDYETVMNKHAYLESGSIWITEDGFVDLTP